MTDLDFVYNKSVIFVQLFFTAAFFVEPLKTTPDNAIPKQWMNLFLQNIVQLIEIKLKLYLSQKTFLFLAYEIDNDFVILSN